MGGHGFAPESQPPSPSEAHSITPSGSASEARSVPQNGQRSSALRTWRRQLEHGTSTPIDIGYFGFSRSRRLCTTIQIDSTLISEKSSRGVIFAASGAWANAGSQPASFSTIGAVR